MIQIVHLPPVRNVHRVDGVAVVSLTAHVDVYLIIKAHYCHYNTHHYNTTFGFFLSKVPHQFTDASDINRVKGTATRDVQYSYFSGCHYGLSASLADWMRERWPESLRRKALLAKVSAYLRHAEEHCEKPGKTSLLLLLSSRQPLFFFSTFLP